MGKAVYDKEQQVVYLRERLNMFLEVLDSMDPEMTGLEDIDRLIEMMDELETKIEQFNQRKPAQSL
ncbi:SE1561 family protein [Heyndrickxia acidiproducens]|uniref:SE1561 family protein n=1 Tax=Heyndrickxia acidiproducens TaxID=1121084 RepID=UPI000372B6C5|nr:SE1561 family protein [Heyndrickxia acidiproducens]